MGYFRFRRTIKIFPGIILNIGKKSISLSFGVRGARHTVGTAGKRSTFGIPGSGLFYTSKHTAKKHKRQKTRKDISIDEIKRSMKG